MQYKGYEVFIAENVKCKYDMKHDLILAEEVIEVEEFKEDWNKHWSKYNLNYKKL